ncbi:hypothetical protein AB0C38_08495 [Amycolatopsis sp. NPDC048633]|uniref:hypothetical protein n=1 Tax=Amycolatopsis sp. NPDC048633 TaxID=3157095 RepID=UPI0033E84B5D
MRKRLRFGSLLAALVAGITACSSDGSSAAHEAPGPGAVYVTNWASDTIAEFSTNRDGSLRTLATSLPVGSGKTNPQGKGTGPGHITTFILDDAGIRSAEPAVTTGSNGAEGIALSHDGKTLYNANFTTNGDGSVTRYPIAADGTPGPARAPVLTGGHQPDLGSITVSGQ